MKKYIITDIVDKEKIPIAIKENMLPIKFINGGDISVFK